METRPEAWYETSGLIFYHCKSVFGANTTRFYVDPFSAMHPVLTSDAFLMRITHIGSLFGSVLLYRCFSFV